MAYVEDYARSWSPRRKARAIERSVDRAVTEAAAFQREQMAGRRSLISQAEAAVAALSAERIAHLGARFGIPASEAKSRLMRLAQTAPAITLKACATEQARAIASATGSAS